VAALLLLKKKKRNKKKRNKKKKKKKKKKKNNGRYFLVLLPSRARTSPTVRVRQQKSVIAFEAAPWSSRVCSFFLKWPPLSRLVGTICHDACVRRADTAPVSIDGHS